MEKAKARKIKKWDEVHGEYEVEVSEESGGSTPEETAGAGPSISRNPMRGIEDMVEQNDNNFDGVINNVKVEPAAGTLAIVQDDKKSVLEKLKEQSKQVQAYFDFINSADGQNVIKSVGLIIPNSK